MPSIKLILVLLLIFGPPTGALALFPNFVFSNPILYGILSMLWMIVTAIFGFAGEVLGELRKRSVPRIADWIENQVQFFFSPFQKKYYQQLKYRHRVFNVRGLRTQGTFTLELEKVFVQLRISLQNPQAITTDLLRHGAVATKLNAWDLLSGDLEAFKSLVIIGPPGCGKTTLLQHLVLTFVENNQRKYSKRVRAFVPIFLFLRDHKTRIVSDAPSLAELATDQEMKSSPPKNWFKHNLEQKRCLVMLDGLDEVADEEQRRKVVEWVDKQVELFGGNRFIITSRPFGYRSTPLKSATVLEVQPFSMDQIKQFVVNWYLANEILSFGKDDPGVRETATKKADDMIRRLRQAPNLAVLAVNPLLLTMITMVHRYRGALPGRRVELYAEICEVLLGHWHSAVGIAAPLTAAQKRAVLQPLALYLMQQKRREISITEAVTVTREPLKAVGGSGSDDPIRFLQEVEKESGLLLEREIGLYAFAHLTFQEYLAAAELLEKRDDVRLLRGVSDSWWHETIRLYAAQTDASGLISACLDAKQNRISALVLAYEILLEARSIAPQIREKLDQILIAELDSEDSEASRIAAEVILTRRLNNLLRVDDVTDIDLSYITCAEYQLFLDEKMESGEFHQPDHWSSTRFRMGTGRNPVVGIRLSDAKEFCKWLTQRDTIGTRNQRYRLPTDAEVFQNPVVPSLGNTLNDALAPDAVGTWCSGDFHKVCGGLSLARLRNETVNAIRSTVSDLDGVPKKIQSIQTTVESLRNDRITQYIGRTFINELDRAEARSRKLEDDLELDLDRFRSRAADLLGDLNRIHDAALKIDRALARDLNIPLDYTLNLELSKALENARAITKDFVTGKALALREALIRQSGQDLDLDRAQDILQKLNAENSLPLIRMFVRAVERSNRMKDVDWSTQVMEVVGKLSGLSTLDQTVLYYSEVERGHIWEALLCIVILDGRIRGNLPAWEGIRIVRERIPDNEIEQAK